jgi:murein DD-endopeptidase MepM/ murein hydrolase activator NlpD
VKSKKNGHYTVMFIPEGEGKTFSLRVHKAIVRVFIALVLVIVVGLSCLTIKSGQIAVRLHLIGALRDENTDLKRDNAKLMMVTEKVKKITELAEYLQNVALSFDKDIKIPPHIAIQSGNRWGMYIHDSLDNFLEKKGVADTREFKELLEKEPDPQKILASVPNIKPVEGWVTNTFVPKTSDTATAHLGIDFAAAEGTVISATAPGIVETIENDRYLGLIVTIKHEFGFQTRYGHCLKILVTRNQTVERGQAIALVGNTGRSSAPHLHYEIIKDGVPVDPFKYIIKP